MQKQIQQWLFERSAAGLLSGPADIASTLLAIILEMPWQSAAVQVIVHARPSTADAYKGVWQPTSLIQELLLV